MKAGAVARSSGSWMSTALGSDVYMGANEPVNSCGQTCLLPTGRFGGHIIFAGTAFGSKADFIATPQSRHML